MNKYLSLFASLIIGLSAFAEDRFDIGVSLIGSRASSIDEYDVNGIVFMTYDGYEHSIKENLTLDLVATGVSIEVKGRKVMTYTDAATISYYGIDNLQLSISALSLKYEKFEEFTIEKDQAVSVVNMSATKFFNYGIIDIDATLGVSLGGKTKQEVSLSEEEDFYFEDTHFYTVDGTLGANIEITDSIDLYLYGSYSYQKGKETELSRTTIGAEVYGGKIKGGVEFRPYVEIIKKDYVNQASGLEDMITADDTMAMFGIRVTF